MTAVLGGCVALCSTAQSSEVGATSQNTIGGTALWLASVSSGSSVPLGKSSAPLKQLAVRTLANRYPCAALALTYFEPAPADLGTWRMLMYGTPTPATIALVSGNADAARIDESIRPLGTFPYDPYSPLQLAINVTSKMVSSNVATSTVECNVVDVNGVNLQRLEHPIRFTWHTSDGRLTGIYEDEPTVLAAATNR